MSLGVEFEQLGRHVLHGLAHAGLGLGPLLRTEPVERRRRARVGGAVLLDQIKAGQGDVELCLLGEFEHHELD